MKNLTAEKLAKMTPKQKVKLCRDLNEQLIRNEIKLNLLSSEYIRRLREMCKSYEKELSDEN